MISTRILYKDEVPRSDEKGQGCLVPQSESIHFILLTRLLTCIARQSQLEGE